MNKLKSYLWSFRYWITELPKKIAWWVAYRLPPSVALYAFVRVSAVTMEAPCRCGYERPYKMWAKKHKLGNW